MEHKLACEVVVDNDDRRQCRQRRDTFTVTLAILRNTPFKRMFKKGSKHFVKEYYIYVFNRINECDALGVEATQMH